MPAGPPSVDGPQRARIQRVGERPLKGIRTLVVVVVAGQGEVDRSVEQERRYAIGMGRCVHLRVLRPIAFAIEM